MSVSKARPSVLCTVTQHQSLFEGGTLTDAFEEVKAELLDDEDGDPNRRSDADLLTIEAALVATSRGLGDLASFAVDCTPTLSFEVEALKLTSCDLHSL